MRPMTFVQGRINAQFLIEGFVASIMTAVGAFGWIVLNYANQGMKNGFLEFFWYTVKDNPDLIFVS